MVNPMYAKTEEDPTYADFEEAAHDPYLEVSGH